MVFGGRAVPRSLGHEGGVSPHEWDQCPERKRPESELALYSPCEDTVRNQLSATQRRFFTRI